MPATVAEVVLTIGAALLLGAVAFKEPPLDLGAVRGLAGGEGVGGGLGYGVFPVRVAVA